MAKIIRFPVREQESVAYGNYTQLIWINYIVPPGGARPLEKEKT